MIETISNAMGKRSRAMADRQKFIGDAVDKHRKSYSAKQAAAGKDIGKPGKNFDKIANQYPGEKGKRIAGAVLNKLRHRYGG